MFAQIETLLGFFTKETAKVADHLFCVPSQMGGQKACGLVFRDLLFAQVV